MKRFIGFGLFLLLLGTFSCDGPRNLVLVEPITDIDSALESMGIQHERLASLTSKLEGRENFVLCVDQLLDHTDPSQGTFRQKVYLSHIDSDAPMVLYLSGYAAASNSYLTEATQLFKANQLFVEHRYFGESLAEGDPEWEYLTIEQSAADIHHIKEVLDDIYKAKWLSTGISKGGQMTMYHKAFYPEDVSASVVYVAPLNRAVEDPRIYTFLENVGQKGCRDRLRADQLEMLMNYDQSLRYFLKLAEEKKIVNDLPPEQFFELSLYEYEFAFWQWDGDCTSLPDSSNTLEEKVAHLFKVGAPGFFTSETFTDLFPFFYQAYSEMGMYGYRVAPFQGLTRYYQEDFSNYRTFVPAEFDLSFEPRTHADVQKRLDQVGKNMIFIHGSLDPWSSTGYIPNGSANSTRYDVKGGTHKSRLKDLAPAQYKAAHDSLVQWMQQNP